MMKRFFKKDKKEKTEPSNAQKYSSGFNLLENILNRPYWHHPTLPRTSTALVEMQAVSRPSSSAPKFDVNDVMVSSLASDFTQMQVGHSGSGPSASTLSMENIIDSMTPPPQIVQVKQVMNSVTPSPTAVAPCDSGSSSSVPIGVTPYPTAAAPKPDVNDVMVSSLASDFTQLQVGHFGSGPSASTLGHTMATTNPTPLEHNPSKKRERSQISSSVRIGEEEAFNKVRDYLTESKVGMVGIHGMGGVGKTTLMKKVCYEFLKPHDFKVIWIVVSKTVNIQKSLMRNLKLSFYEDEDPRSRGMGINEALFNSNDKVAMLLDDICEALDLEELGVAGGLELDKSMFKLIFATRSEDVCLQMNPDQKMKIEWLGPEEPWALFKQNVANIPSEGKLKKLEMVDISAPQVVYKGNIFNECTKVTRLDLEIEDYNFNDILYNFKKLEELHINISKNCMTPESGPFLIKGFMRLTSLKVLRMDGWPIADEDEVILDINKLVIPGATDFLPQLEVLEIRKCRRLEKVHFEKRALQSLCILKISECGFLAHVVGLQHLLQLRELVISNLSDFEEGLVTTSDDDGNGSLSDVQTLSASFPNLQRLRLQFLMRMKNICNDNVSFPSLSEFTLYSCHKLGKLPRGLMNENRSTPMISGKIVGREKWWKGLEWEDDAFEAYLRPLFVAVDEHSD